MALPKETTSKFFNWTTNDFTCNWNKEAYEIKAGASLILPSGIAETFAYHLAIEQMNREGIEHGRWDIRDKYIAKAMIGVQSESMSAEKMKIELMNQAEEPVVEAQQPVEQAEESEAPKKKAGRPPKAKVEEQFEGVEA